LVIDDDPEFRSSVGRLLRSVGLDARLFASAPDFLKSERPIGPTCLALDVRLPGLSGLDFQRELAEAPFLDVRTAVLNDALEDAFRHRYPGFRCANDDQVRSVAA
jgi:FixJ family two-component response regulator